MSNISLRVVAEEKELSLQISDPTTQEKQAIIENAFAVFGINAKQQFVVDHRIELNAASISEQEIKESIQKEMTSVQEKYVAAREERVQSLQQSQKNELPENEEKNGKQCSHSFTRRDPGLIKPTVPKVTDTEVAMARGQRPANVPPVLAKNQAKYGAESSGEAMPEIKSTREQGKLFDPNYEQGYQTKDGDKRFYRAGYDCPKCADDGYRYVDPKNEYTKCRCCHTKIAITPAHPDGFPNRDEESGDYFYGNMEYPD